MKIKKSILIALILGIGLVLGNCASLIKIGQPTKVEAVEPTQEVETITSTKAFTFFDQTFQVPSGWPSEDKMAMLPMEKLNKGRFTKYAYIEELPPGAIVYWFIGEETDSGFVTQLLTQTFILPGIGLIGCDHWVINPDGTITQISCEEFGEFLEAYTSESI